MKSGSSKAKPQVYKQILDEKDACEKKEKGLTTTRGTSFTIGRAVSGRTKYTTDKRLGRSDRKKGSDPTNRESVEGGRTSTKGSTQKEKLRCLTQELSSERERKFKERVRRRKPGGRRESQKKR